MLGRCFTRLGGLDVSAAWVAPDLEEASVWAGAWDGLGIFGLEMEMQVQVIWFAMR